MFGINLDEKYNRLTATKKAMGDLRERLNDLKCKRNDLRWKLEYLNKEDCLIEKQEAATLSFNEIGDEIKEVEKQLLSLDDKFRKDCEALCEELLKTEQTTLDELHAEMAKLRNEMDAAWRQHINDEKNPVKKEAVYNLRKRIAAVRDKIDTKRRLITQLANQSLLSIEKVMANA